MLIDCIFCYLVPIRMIARDAKFTASRDNETDGSDFPPVLLDEDDATTGTNVLTSRLRGPPLDLIWLTMLTFADDNCTNLDGKFDVF